VLSEESAFVALEMLRTNPRPDTGQPAQPPVAWKTGTSWGFRDAWTAGVFGDHVLVVWIGNFDGSSNPAFVGVQAAAPLFFSMVDAIRSQGLGSAERPRPIPAGLAQVEVCRASGDLPNALCRERVSTWFIPGKSPIRASTLHRRVLVDSRSGAAVCEESATTRWEVHEYWAPDMLRLFRDAGLPRREPPRPADCGPDRALDEEAAPTILSPLRGVTYAMRLSKPVALALNANTTPGAQYWFADSGFIGEASSGQALAWMPPGAGHYRIRVVDGQGRADTREVVVEAVP
jgi:penicillin-binding protein 1C